LGEEFFPDIAIIKNFALLQSPLFQGVPYYLTKKPDSFPEIIGCYRQRLIIINNNQIYFFDEKTQKYQAVNIALFNRKLVILNRLPLDYYEKEKYIDIYRGDPNNTGFLRIKLKN